MRYREIPRLSFRKGRSRRYRRIALLLHQKLYHQHGDVLRQAMQDMILHGTGFVRLQWDPIEEVLFVKEETQEGQYHDGQFPRPSTDWEVPPF